MLDILLSRWDEAFAPETWSNWVLVAITLGATVAAIVATIAAFRTLRVLIEQTKDTKHAVEVARLNAEALINSERAWIEISLGSPVPDREAEAQGVDTTYMWSIQIKNHGRTVARVESFRVASDSVSGKLNLEALNHRTENHNTLLGVGESNFVTNIDLDNIPDWESVNNRIKTALFHIVVKYRDVVDSSAEHETSALYVYNQNQEELERVSTYNRYS